MQITVVAADNNVTTKVETIISLLALDCGSSFFLLLSLSSTEQAAGVYHRESRKGRYQLTYKEAKAVCKYEGGNLATYDQLEAARQIGLQRLAHTHSSIHMREIYSKCTDHNSS